MNKKPKLTMKILKEHIGYSASTSVGNYFITTQGGTFEELEDMILEAVNLCFEEEGFVYTIDEIGFIYDKASFLEFYKIIDINVLSKRIRMNQGLLAECLNGIRKPSKSQTRRIVNGVQQIGRELSEARFLT